MVRFFGKPNFTRMRSRKRLKIEIYDFSQLTEKGSKKCYYFSKISFPVKNTDFSKKIIFFFKKMSVTRIPDDPHTMTPRVSNYNFSEKTFTRAYDPAIGLFCNTNYDEIWVHRKTEHVLLIS